MDEYKGFLYRIEQDDDPSCPSDWGNEDVFLGEVNTQRLSVGREGWTLSEDNYDDYASFPVRLLDYGSSGWSLRPCSEATADGHVFVRRSSDLECLARLDEPLGEEAVKSLIDVWNQYLSGDVWFYVVYESDGETILDSLGGIYEYAEAEREVKRFIDVMEGKMKTVPLLILYLDGTWAEESVDVPVRLSSDQVPSWWMERCEAPNKQWIVRVLVK